MYHREVFFATVFTFLLMGLLGVVVGNSKYLSPIYNALRDFEYTDLYYSQYKAKQVAYSDAVVLVNIGDEDREGIAEIIRVVQGYGPKAIGLDVSFVDKRDARSDSVLKEALSGVVLASQLYYVGIEGEKAPEESELAVEKTHPYFGVQQEGYGNFVAAEGRTVRYFRPTVAVVGAETATSFVGEILRHSDSGAYAKLMQRGQTEIINYSQDKFIALQPWQMRTDSTLRRLIAGKYVLVGYLGAESCPRSLEDMHLTPLNKSFGGHAIPDMYGLEIHAHILSMALHGSYVNSIPRWLSWVLAFVITLLHMYVFLNDYVVNRMWFHIVAKLLQVLSFGLVFFLAIGIYHYGNLKIEPSLLLIAIVISVDALYFLDGLMKWLHTKFHWNSYFIVKQ